MASCTSGTANKIYFPCSCHWITSPDERRSGRPSERKSRPASILSPDGRPWQCDEARRGIRKGARPLAGGAGCTAVPAFFAGARRALRRGGNPPAPAFPGGETGKGRSKDFNQSGGDRLSLQLEGHFIVATTSSAMRAIG